jgi:hypothetical protein
MQNVNMKVEGDELVIRINLKAPRVPSKTGKSDIIATTAGNVGIQGGAIKVGVNVYAPR